ncbi:MAG: NUDIX hydrolase [Clostridia bacterium]|nr:NUDIX hydrolase [Clostridia bacterium]
MEFKDIKKVDCGNFLSRYDICYMTPDGCEKVYEMFSRDGEIDCGEKLKHPRTDAVVMILTDREGEHMLLIREFRLELNREIFGLPAGLIDPGETPEEAAVRELKEETGLDLVEIRDVMPPSYSAVGLSNEKAICVIGVADGIIAPDRNTGEEINAAWYSRDELRELVKRETFGAWSQAYVYMWSKGF